MSSNLENSFEEIFEQVKKNKGMNETKLRRIFDKQGVLESFGYDEDDVSVEANIEGKKADYHCRDDYDNVVVVWEFKKPSITNLPDYISQLWDLYVKPLKADYGVLFNGFQIILFKRINSNYEEVFRRDVKDLTEEQVKKLRKIEKPDYSITKLKEIREYFDKFEPEEEKITLQEESSREHFYKIFRLTRGSVFENLLSKMVELFERQYETYQKSKFLTSAYDFWKEAYANEPEEVPKQWKGIMERLDLDSSKEEDLFKFMFCLETSYALFTRLILAKACEDYEFPGVEFSGFIERKVRDFSFRGKEISRPAWAVMAKQLIERMRDQLVESIFEEDIFYWWTSAFKEIEEDIESGPYSGKADRATVLFGEAVAKLLFAVYKFDFSKIIGDPLGNLYQRYFDKKTRKALGEFYTPQEVVDYIIGAVDYKGPQISDERLLDPACGSGTFLVTALNKYLSEAEKKVKNGSSWTKELKKLCNEYHIVGFDIHPFATIMAQIQFMLVLLEPYKKALEEDSRFVLNRIPVFRTDSLIDERKSGKVDLESFGNGEIQSIKMPLKLPIYEEKEEDFVTMELVLPYKEAVIEHEVDILNTEEYFKGLEALFDTVKKRAKNEIYTLDKEDFKTNLKHYLENKKWSQITNFLEPYGDDLLEKIKKLKYEYGDGRLVKSIEDLLLASVLKNYVKYDYVVGNPPYVRIDYLPEADKEEYRSLYENILSGKWDLYMPFLFRGGNWLTEDGKSGFICSNKFFLNESAKGLREKLLDYNWDKIIDLSGIKVFAGSLPAPAIITYGNGYSNDKIDVDIKTDKDLPEKVVEDKAELNKVESALNYLLNNISFYEISEKRFKQDEEYLFSVYPDRLSDVVEKIESKSKKFEEICDGGIREGDTKRKEEKDVISDGEYKNLSVKKREKYQKVIRGSDVERFYVSWETGERDFIRNLKNITDEKRVLIKDMSPKIITAPEYGEYRCLRTIYCATLSDQYNKSTEEIIGQLNSKLEFFYYLCYFYTSQMSPRKGNFRFREQFVKRLPVIPIEKKELGQSVRKIEKRKTLRDKIEEFPRDYLKGVKEKISNEISFEHSHSSISPQIQQRQDGAYSVIIGKRKKEDPIVVNTEEKAWYVKLALEGEFVKKDEKIEVLLPKSNSDVKKILKEFEKDKKKLKEMPSSEELEEEINQIVYDLYGLDDEDIEVIEDFLEKF